MSLSSVEASPVRNAGGIRRKGRREVRERLFAAALLGPALLVLAALILYPLYKVVDISFRIGPSMNLARLGQQPLGLQNYARIFADQTLWAAVKASGLYVAGSVALAFLAGLWTALLLNARLPGRRFLRTVLLLPWAVPGIVASVIFSWMFDGSYGVVNALLRYTGVSHADTPWLMNADSAMLTVIIATAWKAYPLITLTILAAMQTIPGELYEAASVDGATPAQKFRFITLPGIASAGLVSVLISALWIFVDVDIIFGSTGGGPALATSTLPLYIYNEAFQFFRMGTAAAAGVVMMIAAIVASGFVFGAIRKQRF